MIWTLDLSPSLWDESLVFPMTIVEPSVMRLSIDPAKLAQDLLDEVAYMMQANPRHTFRLLTADPDAVLNWMRRGDSCWQLVQRMHHVEWGVSIQTQQEATDKIPLAIAWPVRTRWVRHAADVNLSLWLPHPFSTIGHTGVCEDCGRGRGQNPMHQPGAPSYFQRVIHA